jgi:HKD family nuclease/diadenosine tetraphosphate (Ap4A) HIT family hydrolase
MRCVPIRTLRTETCKKLALCRVRRCGPFWRIDNKQNRKEGISIVIQDCPFCFPGSERTFYRDSLVVGLWDAFPVTPGHALLAPIRHIPTWFEASTEERMALTRAIDAARVAIEANFGADGFNIGINSGEAAGQTVPHLHMHVIPRRRGDVPDPRGGVRHVIPGKGNYIRDAAEVSSSGLAPSDNVAYAIPKTRDFHLRDAAQDVAPAVDPRGGVKCSLPSKNAYVRNAEGAAYRLDDETRERALFVGGTDDPLLPHLKHHLAMSQSSDMAVAFTLRSGLQLIQPHLQDLLDRGGKIRVLTGDYLGATDPDALLRLLDLNGQVECRVFETEGTSAGSAFAGSFHPKAYLFEHRNGTAAAFIGSSNLSVSALVTGVEWNYRVLDYLDRAGWNEIRHAFESLFYSAKTVALTPEWVEQYRLRRAVGRRARNGLGKDLVKCVRLAQISARALRCAPRRDPWTSARKLPGDSAA